MEPLIVMVTFNRQSETRRALAALEETTDLGQVEMVIVDNGSTDGTADLVQEWSFGKRGVYCYPLDQNIGCPRALNLALEAHRQPGQAVVKIDNDVRLLTPGWVEKVQYLEQRWLPVAMIGAYYRGVLEGRLLGQEAFEGQTLHRVRPIIGHCVWHSGLFLDRVGFFDVLAPDHLYGFEDLILSHKASRLGFFTLVWEGWRIENIQRKNSLGDQRDEHVERMRPLYRQRCAALAEGGTVRTGPDGLPAVG